MRILFTDIEDGVPLDELPSDVFEESVNHLDLAKFKDVEILSCRSKSKISKEIMDEFPELKLICTRTVGVDHIDVDYAKSKNIEIFNIPDYGSHAIAEHVFALILTGMRKIKQADYKVRNGEFSFSGLKGSSLKGKTLGVLGTGKIGESVIDIAKGFGMKIIAYDVVKKDGINYVELDELFKDSDVMTLHLPLLDSTKYIINKESISKMKKEVVLINASRGELINTKDLIENKDKFSFIGLDVLENEKKFNLDHPLLNLDNVLITPHIAFYTEDTIKKTYELTLKKIKEFAR